MTTVPVPDATLNALPYWQYTAPARETSPFAIARPIILIVPGFCASVITSPSLSPTLLKRNPDLVRIYQSSANFAISVITRITTSLEYNAK